MLKLCIVVLDRNLPADARISNVYFGRRVETHRRSRTKIEAGTGEGCMMYRLRSRHQGKPPWAVFVRLTTDGVPPSTASRPDSRWCQLDDGRRHSVTGHQHNPLNSLGSSARLDHAGVAALRHPSLDFPWAFAVINVDRVISYNKRGGGMHRHI